MDTDLPRAGSQIRNAARILALAVLFGAASAWIKGNDAGLRDAIGNASAAATLAALAGFCAVGVAGLALFSMQARRDRRAA